MMSLLLLGLQVVAPFNWAAPVTCSLHEYDHMPYTHSMYVCLPAEHVCTAGWLLMNHADTNICMQLHAMYN